MRTACIAILLCVFTQSSQGNITIDGQMFNSIMMSGGYTVTIPNRGYMDVEDDFFIGGQVGYFASLCLTPTTRNNPLFLVGIPGRVALGLYIKGSATYIDYWGFKNVEVSYVNGMAEGVFKLRFTNGELAQEGSYKNGLKEGVFKLWYSNRQLLYEGHFMNGKAIGTHLGWHKNGQQSLELGFKDGYVETAQRWNNSGLDRSEDSDLLITGWSPDSTYEIREFGVKPPSFPSCMSGCCYIPL